VAKDNTVGSRPTTVQLAYIAGFLDGDGSLMMQIKKRSESPLGTKRFMLTICFYQDSRHEQPLLWIRKILGIGYFSRRNDGMSELRINGYEQIERILRSLLPYLKFKRKQAVAIIRATQLLRREQRDEKTLRALIDAMLIVQGENYATRKKRSRNELLKLVGLTP
jgi:hypothetical protein